MDNKLKAIGFILILVATLLYANLSKGALVQVTPWKRIDGSNTTYVVLKTSTWEMGTSTARIAKIWATAFDVSGAFTLGGTVGTGGIDMDNSAILYASYVSAGYYNATGTLGAATSTFEGAVVIATSTETNTYELAVWGDVAVGANTTPPFTISSAGAVVALSYGGIIEANLLDKSATEIITGTWTLATTTLDTGSDFTIDSPLFYVDAGNNRIGISTTTPQTDFVVNDASGTSTVAVLSDGSGFGGELQIQGIDGNCYSMICLGIDAGNCGWATSTCSK